MILTIITINRNNAPGLEKTIQSVLNQTSTNFEFVVVDGASTDGSVEVIRRLEGQFGKRLKWVSEPDSGIYNAMNKGIGMAGGEYIQILNSGDCLAANDVVERMLAVLNSNSCHSERSEESDARPTILYGNMLKDMPNGKVIRDKSFAGKDITFLGFYTGTLNHSPAYIKRSLFDKYGLYDESLKIVSDWKWYLQAIILGEEKPVYTDLDVTLFDMNGISETNEALSKKERQMVLTQLFPDTILADYEQWHFPIAQMKRLKRHPMAYKMVWFLERCLFKLERKKK